MWRRSTRRVSDGERPYLVMEYVPGRPITHFCDDERISIRERVGILGPVCWALHHAHTLGIVHRDVKPSNVLVSRRDGQAVPKVIDFGVAKATEPLTDRTLHTEAGQFLGTPDYMSPEQIDPERAEPSPATDVYSVGVVLYELLTGTLPYGRARPGSSWGRLQRAREREPSPPSRSVGTHPEADKVASQRTTDPAGLKRQLRGDLDWIVLRALAVEPWRRYASAWELSRDLERFLRGEPVSAGPPSLRYRLRKTVARHRTLLVSLLVIIATLTVSLVVSTSLYLEARRARVHADREARKARETTEFLREMLTSADPADLGREVTVREVLERAASGLSSAPGRDREIAAAVHGIVGESYVALGDFQEAEPHRTGAGTSRRSRSLGCCCRNWTSWTGPTRCFAGRSRRSAPDSARTTRISPAS